MQDKWHLLYCACSGTGTTIDAQRPYVARYSSDYTATDLRGGDPVCSVSNAYTFLVECYVLDANLAAVKSDPAINYLFEMPPRLDDPLSSFIVQSDIDKIQSNMELRGYVSVLDITLTFRDLYRSLMNESLVKMLFAGDPLSRNIESELSSRKLRAVVARLRSKGFPINPSIFRRGLTVRNLIIEVKKNRKKDDAMRRMFKTHMDVPHVYKPGLSA